MYLSFQGIAQANDPLLNNGLVHLDWANLASGTYLYASTGGVGGITTFKVQTNGSALQRVDQDAFAEAHWTLAGDALNSVSLDGVPVVLAGGSGAADLLHFAVNAQGRVGSAVTSGSLPSNVRHLTSIATAELSSKSAVYTADETSGYIHWQVTNGSGSIQSGGSGYVPLSGARHIAVLPDSSRLVVTDTQTDALISFDINAQTGALTETGRLDADDGYWSSNASDLATISAFGTDFAFVADAQAGSLIVARLESDSALVVTDHVVDNRETRFGNTQAVSVAATGDHVFVVAGGGDDGLSLFRLLPNGRLVHLEALVHNTGLGLENVTALTSVVTGQHLQIFATSQTSGGVAHFIVNLSQLGDVLIDSDPVGRWLQGTAGADLLRANAGGHDTLDGGAGADILVGDTADVTMIGGAGADRFVIAQPDTVSRVQDFEAGVDILDLSGFFWLRRPDQLTVTPTSSGARITFRDAEIIVTSQNGAALDAEAIFGAEFGHPDHMLAPVAFEPDPGSDDIVGTNGADTLAGTAGADTILAGGGADFVSGHLGADTIRGEGGNDTLHGGAGNDSLEGGAGADTLIGEADQDWLNGGQGNDRLEGGLGDDTLLGGEGDDKLYFDAGADIGFGGAGRDSIEGGNGEDIIDGGDGKDTLKGGPGSDELWGAGSDDDISGNEDDDQLAGGTGRDVIRGQEGNDTVAGGAGDDRVGGGPGSDVIFGNSGNDRIWGDEQDDKIWGGTGNDSITGGDGSDLFVFSLNQGSDLIYDFTPGYDRIQIYDPTLDMTAIHLRQSGDDVLFDLGTGDVRLANVDQADLSALDFFFGV